MTSPIRTTSPATVTLARSTGAAMTLSRARGAAMTSSRACADAVAAAAASSAVARRSERAVIVGLPSAEQRGRGLHHLVGRAHHLGVHLVGALRRDQVGNLGDHLDVGLLRLLFC